MPIEVGQQLLHYRLIEKIGEGGMGVVWKAEDTKLHRHIALKVLPEAMAADPERRARFEREARAVAALNHPNIVTLHSVEEADTSAGKVHLITMELVEGRTLTQLLPRNGFPLNRLLEIAIPLADAVSRAHRAGITHRDLKPDNLMIDDEGRLRVLDFGLAKLHEAPQATQDTQAATVTSDTAEGRVLGTVAYMSPEQAEGKNVDARSDVFSLGTVLYEMASGTRPFQGDTRVSTIGAILKDEPLSITELKPSLPRHLGRVIRRCLAKDPDRRYQSAHELRNELEELKAEVDSATHEIAAPVRRQPGTPRWIPVAIGIVAVAALLYAVLQWQLRSSVPEVTYTAEPITTSVGWETGPNWSPEGEFIAYSRVGDQGFDVMVQPIAASEASARGVGPGDEQCARWSPDGRYLAYVSSSEPGTPVYVVPPHGGAPKKLIETGIPALLDIASTAMGDRPWSPDGRSLVVARMEFRGAREIFKVDRDNGNAERLTYFGWDSNPSYSFDGKRVVFNRSGNVMAVPADGGDPELLLEDANYPAFRPDDGSLLFMSNRDGVRNLWELDLATRETRRLTAELLKPVTAFSVSATNRIAYEVFWHDTFLFAVDVASGEQRQLTSHARANYGAHWSPDGRSIAYHSTRTGNSEIFLYHLDGTPETQITDDPGQDEVCDWSPDSRRLGFISYRGDGKPRLYVANRDGSGARPLVDRPIQDGGCRWSPDGERIAFMEPWFNVRTVDPQGGDEQEVVDHAIEFDWYRDTRRGIYTVFTGTDMQLSAIHLVTGEKRLLYTGPVMEIDAAPDGSAVSFCYGHGHSSMGVARLKLEPPPDPDGLPTAVGEPEYIVKPEGPWHFHNGSWSPDSKSIVVTRDQDFGNIFELVPK